MSSNAIASFLLWSHKWPHSSSTLCRNFFVQGMYPGHHAQALTICSSAWISIIWRRSDLLLQTYAPYYSLQSRCNLAVSSHLFPFSAIQHPHRDASYQQQHRCLTATHNQHIVRLHFKNSIGNMFCHLHVPMNSASAEQRHPWSHMWFIGHCHDQLLCLPLDGQHGQEGCPYRYNVQILWKSHSLWPLMHNSACLHPPACLQADKRQINMISSGCTSSWHISSKCLGASLLCPCMAHLTSMAVQVTKSWDGILLKTLQASSMLPHFAYMSSKLLPTKTSESHPCSTICWWTHLPSSRATILAHAFSTPKKARESGCTLSFCICWNSSSTFCPCLDFTCANIMAFQVTTSQDGILSNTLQDSSMLPHFAYMSTKL